MSTTGGTVKTATFSSRPPWLRYAVSLATVAGAIATRMALNPVWGEHKPFLVFFPAVMIAAWFGGFGPGALTSALSMFAVAHWWTEPMHPGAIPSLADSIGLLVFFASGCIISLLNDSLHRARARERAARAKEERLRLTQQEVMAIVAHDLRNPLNVVSMNAALLTKNERLRDDAEALHRVDVVARAVRRMDSLIGDLLDASRLEEGHFSVTPRDEPLEPVVREALDSATSSAQAKGIVLEHTVPSISVHCDRQRVLQVLSNLLGNAIRFTPPAGRVRVSAVVEGPVVVVRVTDTGIGIRGEDLPRVFDRFWRADRNGTGLGLYIAKGIIESHGGRISVESALNVGTSFRFTLPVSQSRREIRPAALRSALMP